MVDAGGWPWSRYPFSEEPDRHATEDALASWGLPPSGGSQVPHPDPRVVRRLLWIDA